jgi:hypothetical protein
VKLSLQSTVLVLRYHIKIAGFSREAKEVRQNGCRQGETFPLERTDPILYNKESLPERKLLCLPGILPVSFFFASGKYKIFGAGK